MCIRDSEEAAAIGCNMALAPVCDINYNWENTEIVTRAFGNDPVRVAQMLSLIHI